MRAAVAAGTLLAAAAVLATVAAFAGRGLDLTDEAYYVLSMQAPGAYRMTSTLFGYALRPVYLLLGGSITGLRIFGLVALSALGAVAVGLSLRSCPRTGGPSTTVAFIAAGAALPAMYYGFWLPTPSYNWLVLAAGLLLTPAILLLAEPNRGAWLPAGLAALAGVVAALAKPPTAAAYGSVFLVATVLLVREPRRIVRQLALALASTVAGLAVLAALLPLATVWEQTRGYVEMHGAAPPAGRGPVGDVLAFLAHPRGWPFAAALAATALAAWPHGQIAGLSSRRAAVALAIASAAAATALALAFPVYAALGPGLAALAYAAVALALFGGADRRICLGLALVALLPWAAAFGSTNDLASQTTLSAGIFGLVALMAARCARPAGTAPVVVALCLVLVTGSAVWRGLGKPYRLATPVWSQTEPVEVGAGRERLLVDGQTATFISSLRDSATRNGFCAGDPVIDLTGELPGVAVVLGAQAPGLPWLFGGYAFSEELARWALAGVDPRTRDRAWLVVGEGRIAFSGPFVASLGFAFPTGYVLVVDAKHPIHGTPVGLHRPRSAPGVPRSCPAAAP